MSRLGGQFDCSLVPLQTRKRATAKEKEKEKLEKSLSSIEHVRVVCLSYEFVDMN